MSRMLEIINCDHFNVNLNHDYNMLLLLFLTDFTVN
jgi:hypothetical protein